MGWVTLIVIAMTLTNCHPDGLRTVPRAPAVVFNRHALTAIRAARHLSKADLCRLSGVSAPYLTQLENGARTTISARKIREIAEALECDPRALYASAPKDGATHATDESRTGPAELTTEIDSPSAVAI